MNPILIAILGGLAADERAQADREVENERARREAIRRANAPTRPINPAVLGYLRGHLYERRLLDYLEAPDLEGWRDIRGILLIPLSRSDRLGLPFSCTAWQAVARYSYERQTGQETRHPPWSWTQKDPGAYPDPLGQYPPSVVLQRAILRQAQLPVLLDDQSEEPLQDQVLPPVPTPAQLPGPSIVLYEGYNPSQHFWESEHNELGVAAMLIQTQRKEGGYGYWSVFFQQNAEDGPHVLTSRISPESTTTRTTGGASAEAAVQDAYEKHGLRLELSTARHWTTRGKPRLVPGPLPA